MYTIAIDIGPRPDLNHIARKPEVFAPAATSKSTFHMRQEAYITELSLVSALCIYVCMCVCVCVCVCVRVCMIS